MEKINERIIKESILLAESWQKNIETEIGFAEKKAQNKLGHLVQDKISKNILVQLFDQAFRSNRSKRVVAQFIFLLKKHGIPHSFSFLERILLAFFKVIGGITPKISLFLVKKNILSQTSHVVLDDEPAFLKKHTEKRARKNITLNLNLLGEMVLGEKEANNRLEEYLRALEQPYISYVSVKISCICSQLKPLAFEHSKQILKERLRILFRQAIRHVKDGTPKFINLDMEAYNDLVLTFEIFTETLDEKEFKTLKAGIVLQAYLADSLIWYEKLLAWAKQRVQSGGAPIKMRLVKGANLQMEKVEASLNDWECPVFDTKIETDANFKKVLTYAMQPDNIEAIHLGVASHNLFDIAFSVTLSKAYKINQKCLSFEMLEGISEASMKTIHRDVDSFVLYAPVAGEEQFINAITYLIRRLDENTGKENFLRYAFNVKLHSEKWEYLKKQFAKSCELTNTITHYHKRHQNRLEVNNTTPYWKSEAFDNEPISDFHVPENMEWVSKIKKNWQPKKDASYTEIPVTQIQDSIKTDKFTDFYYPHVTDKIHTYRVFLSEPTHIEKTLSALSIHQKTWGDLDWKERCDKVAKVAQQFRKRHGDLIGSMARVTGKNFSEGDVEICEAIDFAEYYPYSLKNIHESLELKTSPKGIVLVIAPWNFPAAIPAGGVLAALAAGNSVILKPAPETMPIAWELAKCFWEAGIPKEVFQIINCEEDDALAYLVNHKAINQIIFTGGTDTFYKILNNRSDLPISAETGGKNAMIVTSISDWDKAISDIIQSAFSNSGQKCSAASLLILEKELFYSKKFKEKLKDAAESLMVGDAFELANDMSLIIHEPNEKIRQALENLEDGEEWLVPPKYKDGNKKYMYPCIKWNVKKGSFSYNNELFAPILSVLCAESFEEAITLVNDDYGLTSGIQSLDEREIDIWKKETKAGNLYVNRGITGAIVQRQPFGGFLNSESAFGTGIKAGGSNYVLQFLNIESATPKTFENISLPSIFNTTAFESVSSVIKNYIAWEQQYFSKLHDPSQIIGQDNHLKYVKGAKPFLFRVEKEDALDNILLVLAAAHISGNKALVSISSSHAKREVLESLTAHFSIHFEDQETASERVGEGCFVRMLNNNTIAQTFQASCNKAGVQILSHLPTREGRIDLMYYFQEQSISEDFHRYGNLGLRE